MGKLSRKEKGPFAGWLAFRGASAAWGGEIDAAETVAAKDEERRSGGRSVT